MPRARKQPVELRLEMTQLVTNLMDEQQKSIKALEEKVAGMQSQIDFLSVERGQDEQKIAGSTKERYEDREQDVDEKAMMTTRSEPEDEMSPDKRGTAGGESRSLGEEVHEEELSTVQKIFVKHAVIPVRNLGDVLRDFGVHTTVKELWVMKENIKVESLSFEDFVQLSAEHGLARICGEGGTEGLAVDQVKKTLRWADAESEDDCRVKDPEEDPEEDTAQNDEGKEEGHQQKMEEGTGVPKGAEEEEEEEEKEKEDEEEEEEEEEAEKQDEQEKGGGGQEEASEVRRKEMIRVEDMPAEFRRRGKDLAEEEVEGFLEPLREQGIIAMVMEEFVTYVEENFDDDVEKFRRKRGTSGGADGPSEAGRRFEPSEEWMDELADKLAVKLRGKNYSREDVWKMAIKEWDKRDASQRKEKEAW